MTCPFCGELGSHEHASRGENPGRVLRRVQRRVPRDARQCWEVDTASDVRRPVQVGQEPARRDEGSVVTPRPPVVAPSVPDYDPHNAT